MKTSLCANSSDLATARAMAARLGGARLAAPAPHPPSHGFTRFSAREAAGGPVPAASAAASPPSAPARPAPAAAEGRPSPPPPAGPTDTARHRWATLLARIRATLHARALLVMDGRGLTIASAGEATGWDQDLVDSIAGRLALALDQADRIAGRDAGPCVLALPLAGDWLTAVLVDSGRERLTALVLAEATLDADARAAVAAELRTALEP